MMINDDSIITKLGQSSLFLRQFDSGRRSRRRVVARPAPPPPPPPVPPRPGTVTRQMSRKGAAAKKYQVDLDASFRSNASRFEEINGNGSFSAVEAEADLDFACGCFCC